MKNHLLKDLPSIDELMKVDALAAAAREHSPALVKESAREALEGIRAGIIAGARAGAGIEEITGAVFSVLAKVMEPRVRKVVNASGTVLHTNIGRAVLADAAIEAMVRAAGNINLEYDLEKGARGERDALVDGLLQRLTGAEGATVVNNNAAAVLLALNTLAEGREVIISRGELIEIGGSFRLPDIIRKSGCVLREVGTTNRTHPADYESAINEKTALILKAHTSNYRVVGFTAEVGLKELARIGARRAVPVVEDLGSGSLLDLSRYGLPKEPVVRESIDAGAALVTFSADKLLGGPQAGIIAGRKDLIEKTGKNPLKRAMRADKITLSALEATLMLYLNPERLPERLPTLRHLTRPLEDIERAANEAAVLLREALGARFAVAVEKEESVAGGGSLPGRLLLTWAVSVTSEALSPEDTARLFLAQPVPVLGRIKKDKFLLDMRTVDAPKDVVPVKTP